MSGSVSVPPRELGASAAVSVSARAALVVLLFLALIPSLLVMLDRWLNNQTVTDWFRSWLCRFPSVCELALPAYFVVVIVCAIGVILLVSVIGARRIDQPLAATTVAPRIVNSFQRIAGLLLIAIGVVGAVITFFRLAINPQRPGWEYIAVGFLYLCGWFLYAVPLNQVIRWFRANALLVLGYALAVTAVSMFLNSFLVWNQITLVTLIVAAPGALILYRQRQRISPAFWLLLLALVGFSLQLNAWYYAFIGDEYAFYDAAAQIARAGTLDEFGKNLLYGTFVYSTQPYFSSFLGAIPFKLFDELSFGWRYGSILASAFSIVLFYYFFKTFLARWVAVTAAFLIAASHYFMSFSRIGYNNTQALLAMGIALAASAWAVKSRRDIAFVGTGTALAFCFYVYPTALYIVPVALLLLLMYHPPRDRIAVLHWLILATTLLILVLPLFFQPEYWSTKFESVPGEGSTPVLLAQRLITQFGYTFFSFVYSVEESHFVSVALVDALTGAFVLVGLGVLIKRFRADKFARFLLFGLVLLVFVLGSTHRYLSPPLTRIFLLVPWFCLVAAIGLQWLVQEIGVRVQNRRLAWGLVSIVFLLILSINLYQAYILSPTRSTRDQKFEALLVHLSKNLAAEPDSFPQNVLLVYEQSKHHVPTLQKIIQVYYLPTRLSEQMLSADQVGVVQPQELVKTDQIVLLSPLLNDAATAEYRNYLSTNNWHECQLFSLTGGNWLGVWSETVQPSPCTNPQLNAAPSLPQLTWGLGQTP